MHSQCDFIMVMQLGGLLATEAILEQASELGVAEGHKHQALLPGFPQRIDALCQRQQRPAGLALL